MNILFYQPYNQTVVYIESLVEAFAQQGHQTFFISHAEKGDTHFNMEKFGCQTLSMPVPRKGFLSYYYKKITLLVEFCKKHQIDVVYSHYQEANIVAVLAQYFTKAKFIITRHHSDCGYLDHNRKEIIGDKIINKLAKVYIAPSKLVYDQITKIEKGNPAHVRLINYGYNFDAFEKPNPEIVSAIRNTYSASLLIVEAARMIPEKRHYIIINSLRKLIDKGLDIKVLFLGTGPEFDKVQQQVKEKGLENNIFLLGFKRNIPDYFAAADLIVHVSESEASNSAIKEAGLVETPVVVCENVGDFSDYIYPTENGFLLAKDLVNAEKDLSHILEKIYHKEYDLAKMGANLKKTVLDRFSINIIYPEYEKIHKDLNLL